MVLLQNGGRSDQYSLFMLPGLGESSHWKIAAFSGPSFSYIAMYLLLMTRLEICMSGDHDLRDNKSDSTLKNVSRSSGFYPKRTLCRHRQQRGSAVLFCINHRFSMGSTWQWATSDNEPKIPVHLNYLIPDWLSASIIL